VAWIDSIIKALQTEFASVAEAWIVMSQQNIPCQRTVSKKKKSPRAPILILFTDKRDISFNWILMHH